MKILKNILLACSLLILTYVGWRSCKSEENIKIKEIHRTRGSGMIVLELFTSEGCSSCPSAEVLLKKLQQEAEGRPVYIMEYHVDYFDNLGWRDVFGNAENTKRQYRYAKWLNAQVYTPQLIINGMDEFIGSSGGEIRDNVVLQSNVGHAAHVDIEARQHANELNITYRVERSQVEDEIMFALVQKNAMTAVQAGENQGRLLDHIQIVRQTITLPLEGKKTGTATLILPAQFHTGQWQLLGILQNGRTGKIEAADQIEL